MSGRPLLPERIRAEAVAAERERLHKAVEALPAFPYYSDGDGPDMCPNCVTPWKCNGPHEPQPKEPAGYDVDRVAVLALLGDQP